MHLNPLYYAITALSLVLVTVSFAGSYVCLRLYREMEYLRRERYLSYDYAWGTGGQELFEIAASVGIQLTPGAREMLLVPLRESRLARIGGRPISQPFVSGNEYESLVTILRTMRDDPSLEDRETGETRSSFSVIRAFWRNFCNIPPFCDGRGRG